MSFSIDATFLSTKGCDDGVIRIPRCIHYNIRRLSMRRSSFSNNESNMYRLFSILCSLYLLLFFSHQYCVFSYTSILLVPSGRGRRGTCRRRSGGRSGRREVRVAIYISLISSLLFAHIYLFSNPQPT